MQAFDVFLSYKQKEDDNFVSELYDYLTQAGLNVWWDRKSMPSRGESFLKAVADAIDASDRMILVCGPKTAESNYVRSEWQYALKKSKPITPVLRVGTINDVPEQLRNLRLHCLDLKETSSLTFDDLLTRLQMPIPKAGSIFYVPFIPNRFQPRHEDQVRLRDALLQDSIHPVVVDSAEGTLVLFGMGGVGKSVLAANFARSYEAKRAFTDGIVWLQPERRDPAMETFSNGDSSKGRAENGDRENEHLRLFARLGQVLNDNAEPYANFETAQLRLNALLRDKKCLLILDNVWEIDDARVFMRLLGSRCRLLITTRLGDLATSLHTHEHHLKALNREPALRLLTDSANQPLNSLSDEAKQIAEDVAEQCGRLPLALAIAGSIVRDGTPWINVLAALRESDLRFLDKLVDEYTEPSLIKALNVSFEFLKRTNAGYAERYQELVVVPSGIEVPISVIKMLWQKTGDLNDNYASQLLGLLQRRSLIRFGEESNFSTVSLHDLHSDYLNATETNLPSQNLKLVDAYRSRSDVWENGPNDGYFYQRLIYHLVKSGQSDEARDLLLHFGWLQVKAKATNAYEMIADYDQIDGDDATRAVRDALRLSTHALVSDANQLASQLIGRLAGPESKCASKSHDLNRLLVDAKAQPGPGLRPESQCLFPPNGPLLRTLGGFNGTVQLVALLPDGKLISSDRNGNFRIWDPTSGRLIGANVIEGGPFEETTFDPETGRITATSKQGTRQVWQLREDDIEFLESIDGVAVSHNFRNDDWLENKSSTFQFDVRCSPNGLLSVSDPNTGKLGWQVSPHAESVTAFDVGLNDLIATGSSDDTVRIWNAAWKSPDGQPLAVPTSPIASVCDLGGGRIVASTQAGGVKVWNRLSGETTELDNMRARTVAALPSGTIVAVCSDWMLRFVDSKSLNLLREELIPHKKRAEESVHSRFSFFQDSLPFSAVLAPTARGHILLSIRTTLFSFDPIEQNWTYVLEDAGATITALCCCGDNAYIGTIDGRILNVDLATKRFETVFADFPGIERTPGAVDAIATAPQGMLIAGSRWKTALILDAGTGKIVSELSGITGNIYSVAHLHDDYFVTVCRGNHGAAQIWKGNNGEEIARFDADAPIHYCAVLADKRSIVVGDRAGDIYVLRFVGQETETGPVNR